MVIRCSKKVLEVQKNRRNIYLSYTEKRNINITECATRHFSLFYVIINISHRVLAFTIEDQLSY